VAASANPGPTDVLVDDIAVRFTSPDREMFPGVTKRDVLDYYLAVAEPMLAQVGGRPTALERWTGGVAPGAEHFFQKHLPKKVPAYVSGIDVRFPSGRPGVLLDPATRPAIAWAVQMSTVTFHAWPVTAPDVARPDQLRIDLDPSPGNDFDDVRTVALACREVLADWDWPSYVKTSGGRGVHVFVPLRPTHSFIDTRHAAIVVGRALERRHPDLVTTSWWKEERGARVFVDFNQNAQDRLMASAYSLRPRPEATASLPITWDELVDVRPDDLTVRTVPAIVAGRPADPWAGMREAAVDLTPAVEAWDRGVAEGLPELPYPPDFPKMPGEPPRVQPSRARKED
jgi:DNA ligase D-like protein (predicted polymerase)